MEKAKNLLNRLKGIPQTEEERIKNAIELAGWLYEEAGRRMTPSEKKILGEVGAMIRDENGKAFFMAMTDQCFRTSNNTRCADQILFLLKKYGVPSFLPWDKRLCLKILPYIGVFGTSLCVPWIKKLLRKETSHVILPAERPLLVEHLKALKSQGVQVNLNRLGEALLGEGEAERRLEQYIEDLKDPLIETISIKISTLCSQIKLVSFQETLDVLKQRYRKLLRVAMERKKFVNLDMEDYRDLGLTVALFEEVLHEPEFFTCSAGIALQAYVRESFAIQQRLTLFAIDRVARGGAPLRVRLVKGANLSYESVEASISGFELPLYASKADVDANYKRMVCYGLKSEHAKAVHIGIASHNIFDVAYALLLRSENGVEPYVTFEMLEGMNDSLRRVVTEVSQDMLLYCPIADGKEFQFAIAYLIRRLDENTSPDNFLTHAFNLVPGDEEWKREAVKFSESCLRKDTIATTPSRVQNRLIDPPAVTLEGPFVNEPDTDFTSAHNRMWAEKVVKEAQFPSLERGFVTFSKKNWSDKSPAERAELLIQTANLFRERRGSLIGTMMLETAKVFHEADAEVSEAIDFLTYYARQIAQLQKLPVVFEPKGVVLVAPPWNFPCSIPTGGVASALAAGNCVVLKPAPEAVFIGSELCKLFWEAGVPRDVLQLALGSDEEVGEPLVKSPFINAVVLTGATSTAKKLLSLRPGLDLIAETGGKNAIIVTALSDRELAIKYIVSSAFSHAGQKCSACSLLILEREVYDSPKFRAQLKDAAMSLAVGSNLDLKTVVNPLIREPTGPLLKAFYELEEGEEWLVEPKLDNLRLMSPGIKLGVKPGSFMHQTELFGPILGVMRAETLAQAIQFANGTPYGLTSGLFSLDEREQEVWKKGIEAGNLYINRGITGAIVLRQPFGGCKASSFGHGFKSGGENTLLALMNVKEAAGETYAFKSCDFVNLVGESNVCYYAPKKNLVLRVQEGDSEAAILAVVEAAKAAGTSIGVSAPYPCPFLKKVVVEDEETFLERSALLQIRFISQPLQDVVDFLAARGQMARVAAPLANQRIELLNYLREVSCSHDYHRYGNLGVFNDAK